jgi:hypothetical protein
MSQQFVARIPLVPAQKKNWEEECRCVTIRDNATTRVRLGAIDQLFFCPPPPMTF